MFMLILYVIKYTLWFWKQRWDSKTLQIPYSWRDMVKLLLDQSQGSRVPNDYGIYSV